MAITVYMVRHGQTMLNRYNRLQGWCDSPLTEKGIEDARLAGRHLADIKFDAAYHTNTMRTIRTSGFILKTNHHTPNLKAAPLTYFKEQGFGYFEAADASQVWLIAGANHGTRTYNDILRDYSFAQTRDFLHQADPFGDAESDAAYWQRLNAGINYLRQNHTDGQKLLLVSHSLTTRSLVDHFAPELGAYNLGPKNGAVTKLEITATDVKVSYYNHYLDGEEY